MNWKQLTLVPPLVLLGACGLDTPTAPELAAEPDAAVQAKAVAALPMEESAGLLAVLEDVQTRILPTLPDRAAGGALDAALGSLAASLTAGEGTAIRQALAGSRRALATLRAHPDARQAAAELDAVELALDGIPEFRN